MSRCTRFQPGTRPSSLVVSVLAFLAMLVEMAGLASPAAAQSADQKADSASARRLQLTLTSTEDSTSSRAVIRRVIAGNVMAYQVSVDVVGRVGSATPLCPWEVTVDVGHGRDAARFHFTREQREFTMPRPLGLQLNAGDSVTIVIALTDGDVRDVELKVSIEYESAERQTRLAIHPVNIATAGSASGTASWEWTVDVEGRILAVAGALLDGASQVQLVDVSNGSMLWSTASFLRSGLGSMTNGNVLRLGVLLRAGVTYRLDVTYARDHGQVADARTAMLMMLPASR